MPRWVTYLPIGSFALITLFMWAMAHEAMWATVQGQAPSGEEGQLLWVWLGVMGMEFILYFSLLRIPFQWTLSSQGMAWSFGFWKKRQVSWADIRSLSIVSIDPWDYGGVGIRWTPRGWFYTFFKGIGIRVQFHKESDLSFVFKNANNAQEAWVKYSPEALWAVETNKS